MVVLNVPRTPLLGAIAAASSHGLTDLQRIGTAPQQLAPYGLVFLPIPTTLVTTAFIALSICHFGHDVGLARSVLLHTTFALLALVQPVLAWAVFALYYVLIHVPRHCARHFHGCDRWLKVVILGASILFPTVCLAGGSPSFMVTDWMQKGVVAHVLVDELHPARREAATDDDAPSSGQLSSSARESLVYH